MLFHVLELGVHDSTLVWRRSQILAEQQRVIFFDVCLDLADSFAARRNVPLHLVAGMRVELILGHCACTGDNVPVERLWRLVDIHVSEGSRGYGGSSLAGAD